MLRHIWASPDPGWTNERFLVERAREGDRIGVAFHFHAPWGTLPRRYSRIGIDLLPEVRTVERASAGFDFVEELAKETGAQIFWTGAREDDNFLVTFLQRRGYREDRRGKLWELDLARDHERLAAMADESRPRMREQGISVLPLSEDRDPEKYRKAHEMNQEAFQDVPTTVPIVPEPLESFMKWLASPSVYEERLWIARRGDAIVGMSVLGYPPKRGNVWTNWTGTARSVRGRGVARALKLETLMQAIALGITNVRTGNDSENAPILHLNEELGYTGIPGYIHFMRDVGG